MPEAAPGVASGAVRRLGLHVSIAGGLQQLPPRALRRHCNAAQLFTSSPAQWARPPLAPEQAAAFRGALVRADLHPYFVHAIYLLNLASSSRTLRGRSLRHLAEELRRAELLGAAGVVFHLGSAGERGRVSAAVARLARSLVEARERAGNQVPLLLENSAGAGHTLGGTPAQMAEIIAQAPGAEPLRLCLDTCHAFAAGLPLHTESGLEEVLGTLAANSTHERLALLHLNDCRGEFALHTDRHRHQGQGRNVRAALRRNEQEPRLQALPVIMETPGEESDDRRNMRVLRRWLPADQRPPRRRLR